MQTRLYEQFWRPMEVDFGQEAYGTHFDGFMRHYLTVKTGEIPNVREVYEAFKAHARSPEYSGGGGERWSRISGLRPLLLHDGAGRGGPTRISSWPSMTCAS